MLDLSPVPKQNMATTRFPLVVVLGATGAGKSKLALEIAKVFKGEIISADSMQIYKGLGIITNKVTEEEQQECKHHLISYLEPGYKHHTVVDFRDAALPIIEDLFHKRILPVIVGGTNYYIESLLWDFTISPTGAHGSQEQSTCNSSKEQENIPNRPISPAFHESTQPSESQTTPPNCTTLASTNSQKSHFETDSNRSPFISSVEHQKSSKDHRMSPSHAEDFVPQEPTTSGSYLDHNSGNSSVLTAKPSQNADANDTSYIDPVVVDSQATGTIFAGRSATGSAQNINVDDSNVNQITDVVDQTARMSATQADLSPDPLGVADPKSADLDALRRRLHAMDTLELYSCLQKVDPDYAHRHHPHNTRKILRALEFYYQSGGRTLSSAHRDQHRAVGQGAKSGPLRYKKPCILWVKCAQPDLDRRLDSRVDTMIERGLLKELEAFHTEASRLHNSSNPDSESGQAYPHGFLQNIGFKEFAHYLQLNKTERETDSGRKLFHEGVHNLKLATRQYARQQVKWINNRFCARPGPNVPPVYAVDSTDLTQWDKAVQEAVDVVKAFIQGEEPTKEPEHVTKREGAEFERNICQACGGRVFLNQLEWNSHLKSKKHKYQVKLQKKRGDLSQLLSLREKQLCEGPKQERSTHISSDSDDSEDLGSLYDSMDKL